MRARGHRRKRGLSFALRLLGAYARGSQPQTASCHHRRRWQQGRQSGRQPAPKSAAQEPGRRTQRKRSTASASKDRQRKMERDVVAVVSKVMHWGCTRRLRNRNERIRTKVLSTGVGMHFGGYVAMRSGRLIGAAEAFISTLTQILRK